MTNLQRVLRPNSEEVASEVMDGEAVLINLSNGMYYSIDGIGGVIWERIEQGRRLDGVCEEISAHLGIERATVDADVAAFLAQLRAENLVVDTDPSDAGAEPDGMPLPEGLSYAPPTLNVYRDMGDLLALDPPMPGLKDIPWKDS